jgi:hypothetical protein
MRSLTGGAVLVMLAGGALLASRPQASPFFPIDQVRPGQVGVGRTVFSGTTIEEFKVHVLGVLRNVLGPRRDLILARLEGGPLATTGVIQGMSGSPVYLDGKIVGAVSYSIGSFPREPIAGITPIAEMIDAVDHPAPRPNGAGLSLTWPVTPSAVFDVLATLARRAAAPVRPPGFDLGVVGPPTLADLAPALRPIGAAMVLNGFESGVGSGLRTALSSGGAGAQAPASSAPRATPASTLRPGDPVGMSLIRGDLEMGPTGTVTWVDGTRVYAFGHPFLNLGPTSFAMTQSNVLAVLPSLDASMKLSSLGAVIGTISQDRATAVGGSLGPGPRELEVSVRLTSDRAADRQFRFFVLHDPFLTPIFSFVAVLNSLAAYERETGVLSIHATGSASFGADGRVILDDYFTGEAALAAAASHLTAPIAAAVTNEFKTVRPEKLDLHLHVSEQQRAATIERAWLDTTRPHYGGTHTVHVLLRDYRGATETVTVPITMPAQAAGPVTLLVSDAVSLGSLEQRELRPGRATSWPETVTRLNDSRRNNRIYVRLIAAGPGTVVGGETLSGLPASVRSVIDADASVATAAVARTIVGAWDRPLDRVVRGSREITLTLVSSR